MHTFVFMTDSVSGSIYSWDALIADGMAALSLSIFPLKYLSPQFAAKSRAAEISKTLTTNAASANVIADSRECFQPEMCAV